MEHITDGFKNTGNFEEYMLNYYLTKFNLSPGDVVTCGEWSYYYVNPSPRKYPSLYNARFNEVESQNGPCDLEWELKNVGGGVSLPSWLALLYFQKEVTYDKKISREI